MRSVLTRLGAMVTGGLVFMAASFGASSAAPLYVINAGDSGHGMVNNAISHLNALGHTVSTGDTLADYSAFDQVWDLRITTALGASDVTAMGNFLAGGGRMYLSGEHSGGSFFSARNSSLSSWIADVGGGAVTSSGFVFGAQSFTAAASAVGLDSNPNAFGNINYSAASVSSTGGNGFLVTTLQDGTGSLVGWDFGNLAGSPDARMLVGWDIEIFQNGQNWTENMYTYLAAPSPNSVSEPGTLALIGLGFAGLGFYRRRKRAWARATKVLRDGHSG